MAPEGTKVTIRKPDDMHLHLRSGEMLSVVAPLSSANFQRAVVMPNLIPPVVTTDQALKYKREIQSVVSDFEPLMTLYLTEKTTEDELKKAKENGIVGCKLYPAGATTNSESGVREMKNISKQLEWMEKLGLVLMMHGEVSDEDIADKDREKVFIDRHLSSLIQTFSGLRMVLEHVSTKEGVQFVQDANDNLVATCTVHHMMFTAEDLNKNGFHPHLYCKPILKSEEDRRAVTSVATSNSPKFFAGTDSAPHPKSKKNSENPPAGIFTGSVALECYAHIFDNAGMWDGEKLVNFEAFMSERGANFYNLSLNEAKTTLIKKPKQIPDSFPMSDNDELIPIMAGDRLKWSTE